MVVCVSRKVNGLSAAGHFCPQIPPGAGVHPSTCNSLGLTMTYGLSQLQDSTNFGSVLLISTLRWDKLYLTKTEIKEETLKYSIPVVSDVVGSRGTVGREDKNHQKKEKKIDGFSYRVLKAAAQSGFSPEL